MRTVSMRPCAAPAASVADFPEEDSEPVLRRRRGRALGLLVSALSVLAATEASGVELSLTGFGTFGYARSDKSFKYLRYIDDDGTLKSESLVGVQAELQFNAEWGATVQAVASAPRTRDDGTEAKIRWAFLSFRPNNDWLIRLGRVRPPVFINTQNAEVGATYDQARLPVEVYSLSPVYDIDGAAVTRTWTLDRSELILDAYWGRSDINYRVHSQSEPVDPYFPERITFMGAVLSHAQGPLSLRVGVHRASAVSTGPVPFFETHVPTPIPGPAPFGGTLYVPTNMMSKIHAVVATLGVDWQQDDWRVTSEFGRRALTDTKIGPDSTSAYLTVARKLNRWTPYATVARLLSHRDTRAVYQATNFTPVPLAVQGPPFFLPANFHRTLADRIPAYDQRSVMLGVAYSFAPTSKLKFEWMRTRIGLVSAFIDGEVHNESFNVVSLSYSAAF